MTPDSSAGGFRHFHDQLSSLKEKLLGMSSKAEERTDIAVEALEDPVEVLADLRADLLRAAVILALPAPASAAVTVPGLTHVAGQAVLMRVQMTGASVVSNQTSTRSAPIRASRPRPVLS